MDEYRIPEVLNRKIYKQIKQNENARKADRKQSTERVASKSESFLAELFDSHLAGISLFVRKEEKHKSG